MPRNTYENGLGPAADVFVYVYFIEAISPVTDMWAPHVMFFLLLFPSSFLHPGGFSLKHGGSGFFFKPGSGVFSLKARHVLKERGLLLASPAAVPRPCASRPAAPLGPPTRGWHGAAGGAVGGGRCGGGDPPVELARPAERAAPPELMRRKM